jgi:hypothetical protein
VTVTSLIPKAKYAEKEFQGAAQAEQTPKSLTMGVGRYEVVVQVRAKLDLQILQARFILDEGGRGTRAKWKKRQGQGSGGFPWKLYVRPKATIVYLAEATSAADYWEPAMSRPFKVVVRR